MFGFKNLLALNLAAAFFLLAVCGIARATYVAPNNPHVWQTNNPAVSDTLVRTHHCWTNDGRIHPTARHAVVQMPGGVVAYKGQKVTNYLLSTKNLPVGWTVYGFCQ